MSKPYPKHLRLRVAVNVKAQRLDRGWSQEFLGELGELSQVYLSKIETGKVAVSVDTIEKLARAFDIDPALLLAVAASAPSKLRQVRALSR